MISNRPPFKGLDVRIPIIIPVKGRGLILNKGPGLEIWIFGFSGLGFRGVEGLGFKV